MRIKTSSSGFTMVEMAVSLAIIGMVAAAIVAGSNVKRKLELQQVIDDVSAISRAVEEFKNTYGSLPGDMYNAEAVFGAANTDDGNGDGDLADEGPDTNTDERLLFWQHLALAGLIEGTYDGATTGVGGLMEGPMKNSVYNAATTATNITVTISRTAFGIIDLGIIKTKEAYDIDSKYDDGNWNANYITSADATNETAGDCVGSEPNYNLTNSREKPCVMAFNIYDIQ